MNRIKVIARYSGLLLASLFALPSHAVPITASSSISNFYVDASATSTGLFDINAAAAGLGFSSPYSVSSATLTFLFSDNANEYGYSSDPVYSSTQFLQTTDAPCNTLNCPHRYYWLDTYGTYGADPWETAVVNVGDQSASASTAIERLYNMGGAFALGGTQCGTFGCFFNPVTRQHCYTIFGGQSICDGPWPVYEQIAHVYDTNGGDFSITLTLDAASLLDLASDGLLNFTLGASLGNYYFQSASLQADVSQGAGPGPTDPTNPTDPQQPVGVPEPSGLFLMAMGLFVVVGARSRWRLLRI